MLLLLLLLLLQLLLLTLLLGCSGGLQTLLLGLRRTQVGILDHGRDVHAVVLAIGQASPDKVLGLLTDRGLARELHFGRLQNDVLL